MSNRRDHVTALLVELSRSNRTAVDALLPLVYDELRGLAHRQLRNQRAGHTLQTTALVHEAYLKLI
ncbi:MAG: ECF-type sigma factor, partial [Bacteroidota bacterium]